ncbi:MAG TPA: hypothetical protein VK925_07475 [Jiangellaceae bacterium]|nr:hypothetical protein [Jiangellaceae bacterium]
MFVVRRAAAHEVADLAFDLGAGRAVVGLPVGVALPAAGVGQVPLVAADRDGAPAGGVGALRPQPTVAAGGAERGLAVAAAVTADPDGDPGTAPQDLCVDAGPDDVCGIVQHIAVEEERWGTEARKVIRARL